MGITFKAEIKKQEQRKDGTWNVKIRLIKDRKICWISTNYYVDKTQISRKSFEITDINVLNACHNIITSYQKTLLKLGQDADIYEAKYLAKYLIDFATKKTIDSSDMDFIKFGESHVVNLKEEKRDGYAKTIQNTLDWLKKHYNGLYITDITVKELENMQRKMLETMKQSSANIYLRNIRTLYNAFIKHSDNDDLIKTYPFRRFKFKKSDIQKERVLDVDTLRKIIFFPQHELKLVNFARDVFTLGFVLLGLNTKDLYCCGEDKKQYPGEGFDGRRLVYYRRKTIRKGKESKTAPLVPDEIKPIFDKYRDKNGQRVFDFYKRYSTNTFFYKAVNKGLKEICKNLGLEDTITTYYYRHSFATIARNDCGEDKYDISRCLTHSSGLDVTDRYMHEDWSVLDRIQRKVIDLVFHGK